MQCSPVHVSIHYSWYMWLCSIPRTCDLWTFFFLLEHFFKSVILKTMLWGLRDPSSVKSPHCPSRGHEFGFQHPFRWLQWSVSIALGNLILLASGYLNTCGIHRRTYKYAFYGLENGGMNYLLHYKSLWIVVFFLKKRKYLTSFFVNYFITYWLIWNLISPE